MGFGILEPPTDAHVAGTVLLDQAAAHSDSITAHLKHGKGKEAHIILSPQPSEDPNDPLNWSPMKKNVVLWTIFFGVIIFGVVPNPLLNAGTVQIGIELGHPFVDIAKINGDLLLATAAAGPFASALGRKYGKRPLYILSSIIGVVGVIIGECATGFTTLLTARVIQGLGVAAYEALGVATIGDLYFVHERGARVAIVVFFLTGIANGISILAGLITTNLGWHYNFHICMPFAVLQLVMIILFAPETTYRRKHIYETDTAGSEEDLSQLAKYERRTREKTQAATSEELMTPVEKTTTTHSTVHTIPSRVETIPPKKTFWQEMAFYNGVFVDDPLWKMVLACPAILFNVGAAYQIFATGLTIAWYVAVAILSSVIFAIPPYELSSATVGYMSTGPLLGSLVGSLACGILTEPFIKYMTRKNKGVYEPEFNLLPSAIGFLFSIGGLIGWGYLVKDYRDIYVISFMWGVILFGMTITAACLSQWALDSYRQNSTEVFLMNMVFKNFFFYGLTNYIIQWYLEYGPVQVMGVVSGVSAFLLVLLIPLWVYGKRYRNYWQHNNLIKRFGLETDHLGAE